MCRIEICGVVVFVVGKIVRDVHKRLIYVNLKT